MDNLVLIVENDNDLGQLLLLFVRKRGLTASRITSTNEIFDAVARENPSLVLLDNQLGDGLGVNYISLIKNTCPDCTIVLMTSDSWEELKEFDSMRQLDGFLSKPFRTDQLDVFLNRLVA